jgi:hypothetical protein
MACPTRGCVDSSISFILNHFTFFLSSSTSILQLRVLHMPYFYILSEIKAARSS